MVLTRVVRFACAGMLRSARGIRRGRCLFQHRDSDADVKPPLTRTEEDGVGVGGVLEGCQQVGGFFDVAYRAVCRCSHAANHGGAHHEAEWRFGRLPRCH